MKQDIVTRLRLLADRIEAFEDPHGAYGSSEEEHSGQIVSSAVQLLERVHAAASQEGPEEGSVTPDGAVAYALSSCYWGSYQEPENVELEILLQSFEARCILAYNREKVSREEGLAYVLDAISSLLPTPTL